jgi:hypothetical protein
MMDKYIRAIFSLNEAIAFLFIKPFDNSSSHRDTLLTKKNHRSKVQAVTLTNGYFPQNETGTPTNKRLHKLLYYEKLLSRFFKRTRRIYAKMHSKDINIGTIFLTMPTLNFYCLRLAFDVICKLP